MPLKFDLKIDIGKLPIFHAPVIFLSYILNFIDV